MTQEEKSLLLKDLSARLPYGICFYFEKIPRIFHLFSIKENHMFPLNDIDVLLNDKFSIQWCKPYLRSMSIMTEEEKEEIALIRDKDFQSVRKWIHDESIKETGNICPITCGEIDFCNKKHLDYRGLIGKGLAIEAPEGIYNLNEK